MELSQNIYKMMRINMKNSLAKRTIKKQIKDHFAEFLHTIIV